MLEIVGYACLGSFLAVIVAVTLSKANNLESDDDEVIPAVPHAPEQLPELKDDVNSQGAVRLANVVDGTVILAAIAAVAAIWMHADSAIEDHKRQIATLESIASCRLEHDGDIAVMALKNGAVECVTTGGNSGRRAASRKST